MFSNWRIKLSFHRAGKNYRVMMAIFGTRERLMGHNRCTYYMPGKNYKRLRHTFGRSDLIPTKVNRPGASRLFGQPVYLPGMNGKPNGSDMIKHPHGIALHNGPGYLQGI